MQTYFNWEYELPVYVQTDKNVQHIHRIASLLKKREHFYTLKIVFVASNKRLELLNSAEGFGENYCKVYVKSMLAILVFKELGNNRKKSKTTPKFMRSFPKMENLKSIAIDKTLQHINIF